MRRILGLVLVFMLLAVVGVQAQEIVPPAMSFGIWSPDENRPNECAKAKHDAYSVVFEGKRYPTWHPPVDSTGCHFGHEHGRNPAESAMGAWVGPIPFGYANEVLMDAGGPTLMRHEDHVGHKVDFEDGIFVKNAEYEETGIVCSVLTKVHQGTHSKDAFTNNVHELQYFAKCNNGLEIQVRMMTVFGEAGAFDVSCQLNQTVQAGTPVPSNSPDGEGDSRRRIPADRCYGEGVFTEQWSSFDRIWIGSGSSRFMVADFNPYFRVHDPSRVFDSTKAGFVSRPLEVCKAGGFTVPALLTRCRDVPMSVAWNDPDSPWRGSERSTVFNRLTLRGRATLYWYTDAYGNNGSATPRANSIRQYVKGSNVADGYYRLVTTVARNFAAPGVRAPN